MKVSNKILRREAKQLVEIALLLKARLRSERLLKRINSQIDIVTSNDRERTLSKHAKFLHEKQLNAHKNLDFRIKRLEQSISFTGDEDVAQIMLLNDFNFLYLECMSQFPFAETLYKINDRELSKLIHLIATREEYIEKYKASFVRKYEGYMGSDLYKNYDKVLNIAGSRPTYRYEQSFVNDIPGFLKSRDFSRHNGKWYSVPANSNVNVKDLIKSDTIQSISDNKQYTIYTEALANGKPTDGNVEKILGKDLKTKLQTLTVEILGHAKNTVFAIAGEGLQVTLLLTPHKNIKSSRLRSSDMPVWFSSRSEMSTQDLSFDAKTIRDICNEDNLTITNGAGQEMKYRVRHKISDRQNYTLNMSKPGVGLIQMTNQKGKVVNGLVFLKLFHN